MDESAHRKSLEVEEDQTNSKGNQTDVMGGLHWPLSAFLLSPF